MYAYLAQRRGIPAVLIQRLVDQGLLYQDRDHGNAVFINRERTFAELRGTGDSPFHGMAAGSGPAAFWAFRPRGPDAIPETAYVCEAAIDAISLYLLLVRDPHNRAEQHMYCSVGGAAKQQAIDAVKAYMSAVGGLVVIAADNDQAGEMCWLRNQDCQRAVPGPGLKDWNEAWLGVLSRKGA